MLATFHKAVVVTAAVAMVAVLGNAAVSYAQRDAGAKARGEVGVGFWSSPSAQPSFGRSMTSETRRSYSYTPAEKGEESAAPAAKKESHRGCRPSAKSKTTDGSTAQAPKATRRSFSYEPSMSGSTNRGSRNGSKAPWSYQKTDPRRYQN